MSKDIIQLVNEQDEKLRLRKRRGLIISPASVGDCVFMLPLAEFMKKHLNLGSISFFGHSHYIDYLPGRTCIDGIRSIESVPFHRLFAGPDNFNLEDNDSFIHIFEGYEWIISFLGHSDDNFEKNLIFIVNCSHAAEITMLPLAPAADCAEHVSLHHINNFIRTNSIENTDVKWNSREVLIRPHQTDVTAGQSILESAKIDSLAKIAVIHPGSGGEQKCWYFQNYIALAEQLIENDIKVIFLLGPAETERYGQKEIQALKAAGEILAELSLKDIIQVLTCADVFIGNDCGITHIAAAAGAKTLAIFGTSNPLLYGPIGPEADVFTDRENAFSGTSENVGNLAGRVLEML